MFEPIDPYDPWRRRRRPRGGEDPRRRREAELTARAEREAERLRLQEQARARAEQQRLAAQDRAEARARAAREQAQAEQEARARAEQERHEAEQERHEAEQGAKARAEQEQAEALRDLEQAKHRVEQEAERVEAETQEHLLEQLLPVLDNLDRTIAAAQGRDEVLVNGTTIVRDQLEEVLLGYGLERFDATGERFDPRLHDAVSVAPVDDPAQDGVCVQQLSGGYRHRGKLRRPARVIVGRTKR